MSPYLQSSPARSLFLLAALSGAPKVLAADPSAPSAAPPRGGEVEAPVVLPDILVRGRGDSLLGVASSASQGTVGSLQIDQRPTLRAGEVLETVPGVIVTQHAGGGKANQMFLRGFNLDHGTDFATSLDGMPVNLPTHGHGQGYTDLNIVIPELIDRVNFQKGVYDAAIGDFGSAGAARIETFRVLPQSLAILEGGMYGNARAVFASSPRLGNGHLLYGVEAYHHDGPWVNPDDYQKFNGLLTYSMGDDSLGSSVTLRGYHGRWDSSDQVAASAIDDGIVPFFGSLDDTTGGESQRYSLQAEWHRADDASSTRVEVYGFYYDLDLYSNFTYFLTDPQRGDQFEQTDARWTGGVAAEHSLHGSWWERDVENAFGVQTRTDFIENGLYQTEDRRRVDKVDAGDGSVLPSTTRADDISQTSVGLYYRNKIQWSDRFRTVAGLRGDLYHFDVDASRAANSGVRTDGIASPKLAMIAGPWAKTEVYLQGGFGFHSNDGRGVVARVDPVTGSGEDADGNPIQRADPLVRTVGAEIGVRTVAIDGLQSTASFWWLDIDSELLFVGDAGVTEPSRPSRRYGVEWANFYALGGDVSLDLDMSFSHAEFRDDDPAGDRVPGAVESVVAAGVSYHPPRGLFGSLRLRYFGPRPLVEDDSFRSSETLLLGGQVGYRFKRTWTLTVDVFNILDRRDHDIDYAYESRVRPGDAAVTQLHFHPVEPIQARVALTARF